MHALFAAARPVLPRVCQADIATLQQHGKCIWLWQRISDAMRGEWGTRFGLAAQP